MRRTLKGTAAAAAAGLALLAAGAAGAAPATKGYLALEQRAAAAWVPGEVLVRVRAGVGKRDARSLHAVPARSVNRIAGLRVDVVKLARGVSVGEALAAYRADPRVEVAEPNYLRYRSETVPTDQLFSHLWGLRNIGQQHALSDSSGTRAGKPDADIDASNAWDVQRGRPNVVIAVIDDGVDVTHPDLATQMWRNPAEATGLPAIDDDRNGKVDDVNGWNFAHNNSVLLAPPTAPGGNSHGTHVAGTIAAALNNAGVNSGVVGVCPGCRIMALRVMRDDGAIPLSALLQALAYAKAKGAQVVNLSLGSPQWSNLEREAIRTAPFLAVVAASNDSLDNDMFLDFDTDGDGQPNFSPSYPASYTLPNVLAVAASNHKDEYGYFTRCAEVNGKRACAFTNWGRDSVDVAAPGVDILSTVPGGWDAFAGTSMATPHVAGVAALVKSHRMALGAVAVKNAIMNSVDRPLSLRTMFTPLVAPRAGSFTRTNNGRVNVARALTAPTTNATLLSDGNVDGARAMTTALVRNSVAWPADVNDVYKRSFRGGKRYRIVLDGPAGKNFDLLLWKPGTKEIWQLEQPCFRSPPGAACRLLAVDATRGTADEVITFRAPASGTYYIHVSAWLANGGAYSLRVRKL